MLWSLEETVELNVETIAYQRNSTCSSGTNAVVKIHADGTNQNSYLMTRILDRF